MVNIFPRCKKSTRNTRLAAIKVVISFKCRRQQYIINKFTKKKIHPIPCSMFHSSRPTNTQIYIQSFSSMVLCGIPIWNHKAIQMFQAFAYYVLHLLTIYFHKKNAIYRRFELIYNARWLVGGQRRKEWISLFAIQCFSLVSFDWLCNIIIIRGMRIFNALEWWFWFAFFIHQFSSFTCFKLF